MKITLSVTLAFWIGHIAFAHEIIVHKAITEHAAASAHDYSSGYADFVDVVSSDCAYNTAVASMVNGSAFEDNFRKEVSGAPDEGGMRSLNHFYDPLTGKGLSNIPLDDQIIVNGQVVPVGRDSFTWASTLNCPGVDIRVIGIGVNVNTRNGWSWKNARDLEWLSLTTDTHANRQTALLEMFRAVGQVVHLLEDASQPEHTRNEQHLFPGSPIEEYGGNNLNFLNYQHGMLNWRAAGFTKMKDFWDRNLYNGNGSALDEDASGGSKLGLAEFSNGNFLGARHLFPEYFTPSSVEYYPLPSRDDSTDYEQVKADPAIGLDTYTLKNGAERKGIYIKKNGDGITGIYLSRINYLGAKQFSGLSAKAFCTIDDPNVLKDYHDILIPKAIEYSAGLLDYFFRGRLVVTVTYDEVSHMYTLHVGNVSGQTFSGGGFTLMSEGAGGSRTIVQQHALNGTLIDDGATVQEWTYPGPVTETTKFILVYKGTIGLTGNSPSDPVDAGIAIAVKQFTLEPDPDDPCSDCGVPGCPSWPLCPN